MGLHYEQLEQHNLIRGGNIHAGCKNCSAQGKVLVYYRWFDTILKAMDEERRIKGGSRKKKEMLINSMNPLWNDLYEEIKFL